MWVRVGCRYIPCRYRGRTLQTKGTEQRAGLSLELWKNKQQEVKVTGMGWVWGRGIEEQVELAGPCKSALSNITATGDM